MTRLTLLLFALFPIFIHAQSPSDCEKARPFKSVQIYDGITVSLEKGNTFKICPSAETNIEDLEITFSGTNLKIRKIAGTHYEKEPQLHITFKSLEVLECLGKANVDTKNLLKQDSLKIILKSGATLYADLDVKYLEVEATEGALLKTTGYANEQHINVGMKATVSAFSLEGITGEVKTTTGGTAKVNIEKKLKATASTGGQVRYKGAPKLDTKTTLGGKIIKDEDE